MREQIDTPPEARLAAVAARQHGVVTVRQLAEAGIDKSAITRRVRAGRLHRLHRGVYAVGFRPSSREAAWMAAVLACGEGAVLSHDSAAALWELVGPLDGPIHVSIPSTAGRARRPGFRIHRCPSLGVSSSSRNSRGTRHGPPRTVRFGIPVTSVPRTIADLRRGDYEDWWVRKAIRQAEFKKYRVGIRTDRSRSDLERDFLAFFRRCRFPEPEVNVKVGRWTVDFLWREARVAVETDFFEYHRGSVAFEEDHERDFDLRRLGFTALRYTGDLLDAHPDEIAAELGEALRVGAAWQTRPNSS